MIPRAAEVVVVGGGVMGASVAGWLARLGLRDVLVLERGPGPAHGSTGHATGGFRHQYDTAVNVQLSLLSRPQLDELADETGFDPEFRACGYLFVARREEDLAGLRTAMAAQREAGYDGTLELQAEDVLHCNPALAPDGIVGGTLGPDDGFMRPIAINRAMVARAEGLGVRFGWGTAVTGLVQEDDRVTVVETDAGPVAAAHVVNAAGAWAAQLAAMVGLELPVVPTRRQVAATVETDALPGTMPMTAFVEDGFHARVRDRRILWLWPQQVEDEVGWDPSFRGDAWLATVRRYAAARFPAGGVVPIDPAACHAGLYEMTPDHHALLGRAPGFTNFWLVNGSSGHGVMHSPALGQLLAELITEGAARSLDVHPLRPERFAEGDPNRGTGLL